MTPFAFFWCLSLGVTLRLSNLTLDLSIQIAGIAALALLIPAVRYDLQGIYGWNTISNSLWTEMPARKVREMQINRIQFTALIPTCIFLWFFNQLLLLNFLSARAGKSQLIWIAIVSLGAFIASMLICIASKKLSIVSFLSVTFVLLIVLLAKGALLERALSLISAVCIPIVGAGLWWLIVGKVIDADLIRNEMIQGIRVTQWRLARTRELRKPTLILLFKAGVTTMLVLIGANFLSI